MLSNIERSGANYEQSHTVAHSQPVNSPKENHEKVTPATKINGNSLPEGGKILQGNSQVTTIHLHELEQVVDTINQFMSSSQRSLNFSLESELGQTIIKVINTATDEVIRQIPSEEAVALAKALKFSNEVYATHEQGLIIETEA